MGPFIVENQQAFEQPLTAVNITVRSSAPREYLTEREVERLMKAAADNRWGHRDATAILIAYRHGLRASELVALRWDYIDSTHVEPRAGQPACIQSEPGNPERCESCSGT